MGAAHLGIRRDTNGLLTDDAYDSAYMDRNGNVILDLGFDFTSYFIDGYACVKDKTSGKYGVIDRSGKYVIGPEYHYLRQRKSGLIEARDDRGTDYYIDINGNRVEPH